MRRLVLLVALAVSCGLVGLSGCASGGGGSWKEFGAWIDDKCVAGKIKPDAAEWLNANPDTWKQHSDYAQPVKENDRILNGDCSETMKSAGSGDWEEALDSLGDAVDGGGGGGVD